jgi:BirA family transcriptional regulator, biotin operon repressor / biotin---[acetyl-CoA-carboxylase] ligase
MRLDPEAERWGFRLATHDVLPSTNAAALRHSLEHAGDVRPLWIVAREQTQGRGRRGNTWTSPRGNLYATLLLHDPAPPPHAPELSFVAALAVVDAIAGRAPMVADRLALKWPNDVLCGGEKLAGILLEGRMLGETIAVAIGIGVNCMHHPAQTNYPATDLAAAGAQVSADDLFAALSGAMLERLTQWRNGADFAAIRRDWLARAAGLGEPMRVRLPDREISGRYEGLDDSGCLVLRLADDALQTIAAGEVFALAGNAAAEGISHHQQMLADGAE